MEGKGSEKDKEKEERRKEEGFRALRACWLVGLDGGFLKRDIDRMVWFDGWVNG